MAFKVDFFGKITEPLRHVQVARRLVRVGGDGGVGEGGGWGAARRREGSTASRQSGEKCVDTILTFSLTFRVRFSRISLNASPRFRSPLKLAAIDIEVNKIITGNRLKISSTPEAAASAPRGTILKHVISIGFANRG